MTQYKIVIQDSSKNTPLNKCMFMTMKSGNGYNNIIAIKTLDKSMVNTGSVWVDYSTFIEMNNFSYLVRSRKHGNGRRIMKCKKSDTLISKIEESRKNRN